jgi:hypothetical protein
MVVSAGMFHGQGCGAPEPARLATATRRLKQVLWQGSIGAYPVL